MTQIAVLASVRQALIDFDPLKPATYRYTAPDGAVTLRRLDMDRWPELHDRLESAGLCPPWTPELERQHRELLRRDRERREAREGRE